MKSCCAVAVHEHAVGDSSASRSLVRAVWFHDRRERLTRKRENARSRRIHRAEELAGQHEARGTTR